jgi:hypothetical protein
MNMVYCQVHRIKHKGRLRKQACKNAKDAKVYGYVNFVKWWKKEGRV